VSAYLKKTELKKMASGVVRAPASKCEALSLNPSVTKKVKIKISLKQNKTKQKPSHIIPIPHRFKGMTPLNLNTIGAKQLKM
jgi:hypothetical protein